MPVNDDLPANIFKLLAKLGNLGVGRLVGRYDPLHQIGDPFQFQAEHVALIVAVDQAVLDLADQRGGHLVTAGDFVEMLTRDAGRLRADSRCDRRHCPFRSR